MLKIRLWNIENPSKLDFSRLNLDLKSGYTPENPLSSMLTTGNERICSGTPCIRPYALSGSARL